MAYRSIIGTYKKFNDDEPFAFGKLIFELDKSDYDEGGIYPAKEIKLSIILDQNGAPPLGFELWCNAGSDGGSKYKVTDPDGSTWSFRLAEEDGSPIDIQELRANAIA